MGAYVLNFELWEGLEQVDVEMDRGLPKLRCGKLGFWVFELINLFNVPSCEVLRTKWYLKREQSKRVL